MDLTQVDMLIERLEKKKSLRPGSPPEVVNGHYGVWRTIRHNRVFMELDNAGKLGRVLIGPPSFVGFKLNEIPDSVWEKLTPRATLKQFKNIKVSDNGIETLKTSVKNAVGPEDTRREALKDLKTVEQLVPIARSAGFTDDEIKDALAGKAPNKPLSEVSERRSAVDDDKGKKPDNVVSLADARRKKGKPAAPADKPEPPKAEEDEGPPQLPKPDKKKIEASNAAVEGTAALAPEYVKGTSGDERDKSLADFIDKVMVTKVEEVPDPLMARRLKDLAKGLRAGKYTYNEVQKEISGLTKNRARLEEKQLKATEAAALDDAVQVKEAIDNFETRLDQKVTEKVAEANKQFKPDSGVSESRIKELVEETRRGGEESVEEARKRREELKRLREQAAVDRQKAQEFMSEAQKARLEAEAAIDFLNELAKKVKNKEVKKELVEVVEVLSTMPSPFSRRSILLRLYQLLQLLLLLIPFI